jgi:lipopolysaccharide transport system ATP-binding protein
MSAIAVRCDGISKSYRLGTQERYRTLRDSIMQRLRASTARQAEAERTLWALRDVSLDIQHGEIVGIIGRNGAGKSTLLKVLSRITRPTTGRAIVYGRVGSLLEVGTGFHPELTGRDNVFLNGAILGMRRAEISRKFDAIVQFAELERFIDTPVKRYSSGMYVRLAFSVAAHMEQEILVVDEVLAVGDVAFQKKCLGRMRDLSGSGRTVLFVSHNSSAVSNLCTRGVVLEEGSVKFDGTASEAVRLYSSDLNRQTFTSSGNADKPSITRVQIDEKALAEGALRVEVDFSSPFSLRPPIVGIVLSTIYGAPLFGSNARMHPDGFSGEAAANGTMVLEIKDLPVHTGSYKLSVWLGDRSQDYDSRSDALTFDYISPRFIANLPPPELIGWVDIPGHWTLRAPSA